MREREKHNENHLEGKKSWTCGAGEDGGIKGWRDRKRQCKESQWGMCPFPVYGSDGFTMWRTNYIQTRRRECWDIWGTSEGRGRRGQRAGRCLRNREKWPTSNSPVFWVFTCKKLSHIQWWTDYSHQTSSYTLHPHLPPPSLPPDLLVPSLLYFHDLSFHHFFLLFHNSIFAETFFSSILLFYLPFFFRLLHPTLPFLCPVFIYSCFTSFPISYPSFTSFLLF